MLRLAVALCLVLATTVASAGEVEERAQVRREVWQLFDEENFAELSRLADEYRRTEARTPSGIWKLWLLYRTLAATTKPAPWAELEERTERWSRRFPDDPTPVIARAKLVSLHGWEIRGPGFVKDVAPESWKPFHEQVARGRSILEQGRRFAETDPHWYEMMILVARDQGWRAADFAALLDEATAKHPTYYPIYFTAAYALTPKWGGSHEAIEALARASVQRTRAVEGEGMYARIYWSAAQTIFGNDLFTESLVDWPAMKRGIDDVLARYPDPWNLNHFARFACLAEDPEKTRELLARVGDRIIPQVWEDGPPYERCRDLAAYGGLERPPADAERPAFACPEGATEKRFKGMPVSYKLDEPPVLETWWCDQRWEKGVARVGPYIEFDANGQWLVQGEHRLSPFGSRRSGYWHYRRPGTCGEWIEWRRWHRFDAETQPPPDLGESRQGLAAGVSQKQCPDDLEGATYWGETKVERICTRDDTREGPSWIFWPNGEPKLEVHYHLGRRDGAFRAYHSNGTPRWEGQFRDDRAVGPWRSFDCDGQRLCSGHLDEGGAIVGAWRCRDGEAPPTHAWLDELLPSHPINPQLSP